MKPLVDRLEESGDPLCLEAANRIKGIWLTYVKLMDEIQAEGYAIYDAGEAEIDGRRYTRHTLKKKDEQAVVRAIDALNR